MKAFILLILATVSTVAYGSIYVRQHAASIQPGKKILASDLNDEFNAIATAVNSIDGSNIVSGSIGVNALAATSSAITLNKKFGCRMSILVDATGTKSINVYPPCEINMDGVRGYVTATQSASLLTDLTEGSLAFSTFYYVYATINSSAGLTFKFSTTAPSLITTRKSTDTSAKYVGTIRTCDATTDIVTFTSNFQAANQVNIFPSSCLGGSDSLTGMIATGNAGSPGYFGTLPETIRYMKLGYTAFAGPSYPAQCVYNAGGMGNYNAIVVAATGNNTGIMSEPGFNGNGGVSVGNAANCAAGGSAKIVGWWEPPQLHQ